MSHDFGPQRVSGSPPRTTSLTDGGTTDAVLDALTHEHRRETVRYLIEADEPVDEGDLYAHVAAEFDVECEWTDPRTRVEVQFHHCHRPKLEMAELVEFDDAAETVQAGERAAGASVALERVEQ